MNFPDLAQNEWNNVGVQWNLTENDEWKFRYNNDDIHELGQTWANSVNPDQTAPENHD